MKNNRVSIVFISPNWGDIYVKTEFL